MRINVKQSLKVKKIILHVTYYENEIKNFEGFRVLTKIEKEGNDRMGREWENVVSFVIYSIANKMSDRSPS